MPFLSNRGWLRSIALDYRLLLKKTQITEALLVLFLF